MRNLSQKLREKSIGLGLTGLLTLGSMSFFTGCEDGENDSGSTSYVSSAPVTYTNLLLEAEEPLSNQGGREMMRSNASSARTWVMHKGDQVSYTARLFQDSKYYISAIYSDDGGGDNFRVYVNGKSIGSFETDSTGGWGSGWNKFTSSPSFKFYTPGTNQQEGTEVSIQIENTRSANGSELDYLEITKE